MQKRFMLALVLSVAIMMGHSLLMSRMQPAENKEVVKEDSKKSISAGVRSQDEDPEPMVSCIDSSQLHDFEWGNLIVRFSKVGAYIYEVLEKKNRVPLAIRNIGFSPDLGSYLFDIKMDKENLISFVFTDEAGVKIRREYNFDKNSIELTVFAEGIGQKDFSAYKISPGAFDNSQKQDQVAQRYQEAVFVSTTNELQRTPAFNVKASTHFDKSILWGALRDRYFCVIFKPLNGNYRAFLAGDKKDATLYIDYSYNKNEFVEFREPIKYSIYVGPQSQENLQAFDASSVQLVSYGTFDFFSKAMLVVLRFSNRIFHNWGVSIVVLTVLIYLLLFPLSFKSMMSMKKMQLIQPMVEDLRVKYKDNQQKLNMEMIELYRREKVNPLGGCLPMILQIPVFVALYQLLMRLIDLRGADFLWIRDLSEPDKLFPFPYALPVIGTHFNLLPLLMGGCMFFQQKLTAQGQGKATSSPMAEQQKMMAVMMPVLFCVLFYNMPSGLVLYWFVNNLLSMGTQWKISKKSL